MPLATLEQLSIGFRGPLLLDEVDCVIEPGQRIGLLGRNGAGKSTLMRILAGEQAPDSGRCVLAPGARVTRLVQEVPDDLSGTVSELLSAGWHPSSNEPEAHHEEGHPDWRLIRDLETLLEQMQLDGDAQVASLSAGLKRRALLGRAVMGNPDLLLLDEPTNHLDLVAIEWLEKFLVRWQKTLLFVTHDREFLRRVATRILEIDRGRIFDWSCDYDAFLVRKEQALAAEEKQNALFDRKLAEEERWIRQGIKARRTRNEGRVRSLKKMRNERSDRRDKEGTANLQIQEADRSGQLVAQAKEVSFSYGDENIFTNLTTTVMRGDKIGIIGHNGAGKTTLLRVLLGELEPTSGDVRLGTNLQIAYFDQLRGQLDDKSTAEQVVADGYDTVEIGGQSRHILGYLRDFLFAPDRARTPIQFLSGGERNRLLLAKLFAKPANVIVLDEPTNDLDSETLEMLEERLLDYQGTLLIVSHDRAFLNNVVTSTIVFEPGGVKEYVGSYDDYVRQRDASLAQPKRTETSPKKLGSPSPAPTGKSAEAAAPQRKLSYKEQQELKRLPKTIQTLEESLKILHTMMADPAFYQRPQKEVTTFQKEAAEAQTKLDTAYGRWEELEA